MFINPINNITKFDDYITRDYTILFFMNMEHTRLREFRHATEPLVWYLMEQRLASYSCTREGWTRHLKQRFPKLESTEGVAFFKSGQLVCHMAGFNRIEFIKMLRVFDPHTKLTKSQKEARDDGCCVFL
ncbi:hypothetical protein GGI25_001984 [Coemansia spiralis]|uniref:Uncharacterized protein n=1 Tax=Coemansia spiralis TaxID=417178 RepID=A0A9W8KZQ6_9FUNG|nr:hypothetical protein GGI25_001984 [Coemansia spiralis]